MCDLLVDLGGAVVGSDSAEAPIGGAAMLVIVGALAGCVLTLVLQRLACRRRASLADALALDKHASSEEASANGQLDVLMSPGTTAVMSPGWRGEAVEATPGYPSEFRDHWVREAVRIRDQFSPSRLFAQSERPTAGATSSAPPSWRVPAPVEKHSADGQRSIAGPTEAGGWQCLTFVPVVEALRYDESAANGKPRRKLQCQGVSEARWEALTRCATMHAWQAAVRRLLDDAAPDGRVSGLE